MTELIVFWLLVIAVAVVLATLRTIYDDGLGRRQPPPSHPYDAFDASARMRPC